VFEKNDTGVRVTIMVLGCDGDCGGLYDPVLLRKACTYTRAYICVCKEEGVCVCIYMYICMYV
jgi:hypothetical protein